MPIDGALVGPVSQWIGHALGVGLTLHAVRTAPWAWLGQSSRQHVYFGSLAILLVIWSMQAGITPGLGFHFLLITTLTLMQGWQLAAIGGAIVLAVQCAIGFADWPSYGLELICNAIVPALFVYWLHGFVYRRLPVHYAAYFFVTVYLGSIVAFNLAGAARLLILAANGSLATDRVASEFALLLPMVSLAEAFLNGLVMALAVVYRPSWVASYDDRSYLDR